MLGPSFAANASVRSAAYPLPEGYPTADLVIQHPLVNFGFGRRQLGLAAAGGIEMAIRHGGQILADQLVIHGCRRLFSVPGESFLPLLDGLYGSPLQNIVCRHEGGAAMMAEATAKLTGSVGVVIATRGPGATNAASGIHVARHDSTPLLLLVGQVPVRNRHRGAFQEIDIEKFFGPIAKWAAEVPSADRIPEFLARAWRIATAGRRGPVVLSLPEDMLHERCDVPNRSPIKAPLQLASRTEIDAALRLLASAKRPLAIVGGSIWSQEAADSLGNYALACGLPVATDFRRQHAIDNRHPNYAGDLSAGMNPELASVLRDSDCLLLLGSRLGDMETGGFSLVEIHAAEKQIIHIHPEPDELGRVWETMLPICASPVHAAMELEASAPPKKAKESAWLERCRKAYRNWMIPAKLPGQVQFSEVIRWLSGNLADDAIVTNGAGNYATFLHRHYRFRRYGTQIAPTSGSMGYGLPAAIAAKLEHPDRTVVCLAGDGCLQMTLNELSTASQYDAPVIIVVANNGTYGTIRMHQEMHFPGRISGTQLANPDFAAVAAAYGGRGETVVQTSEFPDAFKRAQASGRISIIDVKLDPDAISSSLAIGDIAPKG